MATSDVDMNNDDGPVDAAHGPGVDQVMTGRVATNAPASPNHAAAVLSPTLSQPLDSRIGIEEHLDQQDAQVGTGENGGGEGSTSASAFDMVALDALLGSGTEQATTAPGAPQNTFALGGTNLGHELDDFLVGLPDNLPLAFGNYLVAPFDSASSSQPSALPVQPVLNNQPFPSANRTQWMPDFTFGPPSDHIDIRTFLKNVEESLGPSVSTGARRNAGELRPEDVAGWAELRDMGASEKQALVEECSVSDLLEPVTDITSDPARLAYVRDFHNQTTLHMLGHTTESIRLPPEMRDRKKRGGEGKVAGGPWGEENPPRAGSSAILSRTQESEQTPAAPEDTMMADLHSMTGNGSVATPTPTPGAESRGSGRNRKGKSRTETEDRAGDPLLLDLESTLKTIPLRSWSLPETAKHFVRKPRSSDVNVLTEVRPSQIPFLLPEQVSDNVPSRSPSPSASGLWEEFTPRSPLQRPHAIIELSILTPAPHPPHTPRHSMSLALLSSQTLEDISEALVCANRWIPRSMGLAGGVTSGACAVIEGTVYGDGEGDADGRDYAEKLVEYLSTLKAQNNSASLSKRDKDAIMVLDEQLTIGLPMLHTRLDSIQWKLHKPYWFMHDGGCVHWIVASSIRYEPNPGLYLVNV
ncbi:snRNA-activating protein of 50 kDa MW carboxy-terminal protein [Ceratobasidium sp. AG-Ba]|nr:snRNA-activating protein of 50 kDa MW carboxy-terminal protein [Ceratobasidium sp. AG-Ba]QRW08503.1 snRNA-activating protein of 50 kDa MW carboxy-terminal protein [Ceratobasidium sp. AG-Ba]